MSSNIICRKCGGNHFTTKCGREQDTKTKLNSLSGSNNKYVSNDKSKSNDKYVSNDKTKSNDNKTLFYDNKSKSEQIYRLQLSNLPLNMTNEEMKELLYGWGTILKIKVINYEETSVAYIDFKYKEQSEYFVNALDKTSFDGMTLYINSVRSY